MSPDVLKLQKLYDCSKKTPNHALLFVVHIVTTFVFVLSASRVTFLESGAFLCCRKHQLEHQSEAQKLGPPPTTMAWVHKGVEQVNLHEKTSLHYELYIF